MRRMLEGCSREGKKRREECRRRGEGWLYETMEISPVTCGFLAGLPGGCEERLEKEEAKEGGEKKRKTRRTRLVLLRGGRGRGNVRSGGGGCVKEH